MGLVEAVDLVDHQDRLARRLATCIGQDLAQLRRAGEHCVDADDERLRLGGDDFGQGGLAAPRGAVEKQRAEIISFDQARQQGLGPKETSMTDDFREIAGAHARRQRATALWYSIRHPLP